MPDHDARRVVTDGSADNSPTVVYLVGAGRSGSTVLEMILGAGGRAVNVGELQQLFVKTMPLNERCGCGVPFSQCDFWEAVGEAAFGGWEPSLAERMATLRAEHVRQRYVPRLLAAGSPGAIEWAEAHDCLYRAISAISGANVVVDASKEAVPPLFLSRLGKTDIRVLQLVRDPRGVAYSWAKVGLGRPDAGAGRQTMATHSLATTARMWNRDNLWGAALRTLVPSAVIRYEEFADDPRPTLTGALSAAGLPQTLADLLYDDAGTLPHRHAIGGNPVRFRGGPLQIRLDNAWQTDMSLFDRSTVNVLTVPGRSVLALERLLRQG